MRRRFQEWCDQLGISLPLRTPAGALSTAGQQAIEIIRALEQDARIVLMDEPTAALGPSERAALLRMIAMLRENGATMMFISHHLEEVLELCTTVTVLRDGETVCTVPTEGATVDVLVTAMLGEKLARMEQSHRSGTATANEEEVLRAERVRVPGRLHEVSLGVRRGEILGVAGLIGSGRSTLVRALAGAEPTAAGRMFVHGREVTWPRTPKQALRRGVALAPEDRRAQGLVLSRSGAENVMLPALSRVGRWGFMRNRQVRKAAAGPAREVRFDEQRLVAPAKTLSGGNQQKLLLAKWLTVPPNVLIVDEPTRGVDVGGKAEIFRTLADLAARGIAVVMVSEEAEELIALADRVLVLCDGREAGTFEAPMELDAVVTAMFPAGNPSERGDQ
jgi:ABC-type sugar transport system ATPase subunit